MTYTIRTDELRIGMRVRDDFQPYAEVMDLRANGALGIEVSWRLTDGTREVESYPADCRFSPYTTMDRDQAYAVRVARINAYLGPIEETQGTLW